MNQRYDWIKQTVGLGLGGAAAVGGAIVGLALGYPAWPVATLVVFLAAWALWQINPRRWQWLALVPGCALGMVAGLLLTLDVSSSQRLNDVVESTGFEVTVSTLLEHSDCEAASSVLKADLGLLSQRSALAAQVRREMWDKAAAHGCVNGADLTKARHQLLAHVQVAPISAGLDRSDLLDRLALPEQ